MLSINIPVYNIEVKNLILQLVSQASSLAINYEIRIYDDGSSEMIKERNRSLSELKNVIYLEMEHNLGRSAIRNKMGMESVYTWLLFIDADSKLTAGNYLKKYIAKAKEGSVLCGGTCYNSDEPGSPDKLLRWVYGSKREAIPAEERRSKKNFVITSNNFMIKKEVFRKVHFNKDIGPYGHEDTLLGYELFSAGIEILHIDNPVEHTGLEDSSIFLDKTKKALKNLCFITEKIAGNLSDFKHKITFLRRYRSISMLFSPTVQRYLFNRFEKHIEHNLTGTNPSLFLFDLYRIGYYSKLIKEDSITLVNKK